MRWSQRILLAATIAVLVLLAACAAQARGGGASIARTRPLVSRLDGQRYRVHEDLAEPQRIAQDPPGQARLWRECGRPRS